MLISGKLPCEICFSILPAALFPRDARLLLVGGATSPRYQEAIEDLARSLGVADSVVVTGSVPADALAAAYECADVFVCASEHEGFCVPLLEAMHHRVPIVAHRAAAVPGTLRGAGVVVDKTPLGIALAVSTVLHDAEVRARLVERCIERLDELSPERTGEIIRRAFEPLLGRAGFR